MKVECPHCHYVMKIEKQNFGARMKCSKCEGIFNAIEKYRDYNFPARLFGLLFFLVAVLMLSVPGGNVSGTMIAVFMVGGAMLAAKR